MFVNEKRVRQLIFLLIVLAGSCLRFYNLGSSSFWFDEIPQINISTQPLIKIFSGVKEHFGASPCIHFYWIAEFEPFWLEVSEWSKIKELPDSFTGTRQFFWVHFHPYTPDFECFLPENLFTNIIGFNGGIDVAQASVSPINKIELINYMRIAQTISVRNTWGVSSNETHVGSYETSTLDYITQELNLAISKIQE